MNKPVLGFFSTAGEAGFFSPEGFALELSQPVVPFVFSKGLVGCWFDVAGFSELAEGVALFVVVVVG